ncbi:MFS transporter [Comamonas terrigena]|uniref:MFS transporter n=1 Tax=Comamonas terrigena TaxID=32013 RepID=UPI00289767AB|nr:MFS transporter [Comamonas terrigena]
MAVILLGLVLCVMDSTMMNMALPQVARQWQVDPAQTLWVVNANQIASLVLLLPLAALGDRMGYRRVYLGGMVIFGLASVGALLAPSLPWLIVARALQGLGAAGVLSVNASLVRLIYPRAQLGKGMALNSLTVALSFVAGPAVAAAVISLGDWRWLFALHLPLALAISWLGTRSLPQPVPQAAAAQQPLSWLDGVLNIVMFASLFLGVDRLSHLQPGGSLWPAALWLGLGGGVGAWYLRRQRRLSAPMFPLDLLRIPVFALSMCASITAFCAQTMAFLALPFLLIEARGLPTGQAGLLISAWPLALAISAPWVGRMIGRWPAGRLGAVGMALFALGLWALALLPQDASNWNVVWRMALCGMGFAFFQSPNNFTIVTSAPLHRSGAASGMLGAARHVGQGLGAVLLAAAFLVWNREPGQAEQYALLLSGCCAVLAGCFSVLRKAPAKA